MPDETDDEKFQRGVVLQNEGRFAEAAAIYQALADQVLTVKLAINLGVCLWQMGELPQAIHYVELAARHRPQELAIRRLLGSIYGEAGRTAEAEAELLAALAIQPDDGQAKLGLAGLYLSLGRYVEGWPLLRSRIALHPDLVPQINLSFPEWRGQPLARKSILIWVEQGFGDQIQFARFVNTLKAQGAARVSLGCRPALVDLFETLTGVDRLLPARVREQISIEPHDYWCRCFDLAGTLGVTLETLPAEPYLAAPAERRARWADFGAGAPSPPRVGLVWQASPTGFNGANKGLPPQEAQRLLAAGCVSLHPEDTAAQDFADTAAIVERLDLVISIDTSVAHLAGAMGKPCWTLLPFLRCDWRWLRGRTDSPWYPSMRLYRHGERQDWTGLVDRVLADLAAAKLGPA
jgi:tetratricopeptide (TPR) repeat protein